MEDDVVDGSAALMTDAGTRDAESRSSTSSTSSWIMKSSTCRGNVHCNGVENSGVSCSALFSGTYGDVEPFHLSAYVDEQSFRFDNPQGRRRGPLREGHADARNRRLTYKDLTRAEQA